MIYGATGGETSNPTIGQVPMSLSESIVVRRPRVMWTSRRKYVISPTMSYWTGGTSDWRIGRISVISGRRYFE
jgi:hypothetical protein